MHDNALGAFLRARRSRVDPSAFDLPGYAARRVAGLRREELATLAGVSAHYLARLERGSDRHPSAQVVDALAEALELDEQAHEHLRRLAAPPPPPHRRRRRRPERVAPGLELLLARWPTEPAVVVGRYRDVLAATPVATLVNPAFSVGTNLLRHAFLDPGARDVYPDWEDVARGGVAGVRASAGADPEDPRLVELVEELSVASEDFRRMWADHDARERTAGSKRYVTRLAGPLELDFVTFTVNGADGQTLYVFHAEPGGEHEAALAHLAAVAAAAAR